MRLLLSMPTLLLCRVPLRSNAIWQPVLLEARNRVSRATFLALAGQVTSWIIGFTKLSFANLFYGETYRDPCIVLGLGPV